MQPHNKLINIAKITKAHGIKGHVKLISYTENPSNIFNFPCLYDKELNPYKIKLHSKNRTAFIVNINNNLDRNLAENLAGLELYITQDMLSKPEDNEFYIHDLIGLKILDTDYNAKGNIIYVHNFGAGDIIEMQALNQKNTHYLPFEKNFVIAINLTEKFIVFDFKGSGL